VELKSPGRLFRGRPHPRPQKSVRVKGPPLRNLRGVTKSGFVSCSDVPLSERMPRLDLRKPAAGDARFFVSVSPPISVGCLFDAHCLRQCTVGNDGNPV